MPAKIRIDFKRSFSITVLRKKAPNIERGIQLSHFHLLFSAVRAARLLRVVSRAATLAQRLVDRCRIHILRLGRAAVHRADVWSNIYRLAYEPVHCDQYLARL